MTLNSVTHTNGGEIGRRIARAALPLLKGSASITDAKPYRGMVLQSQGTMCPEVATEPPLCQFLYFTAIGDTVLYLALTRHVRVVWSWHGRNGKARRAGAPAPREAARRLERHTEVSEGNAPPLLRRLPCRSTSALSVLSIAVQQFVPLWPAALPSGPRTAVQASNLTLRVSSSRPVGRHSMP